MSKSSILGLSRTLLREIRRSNPEGRNSPVWRYVISQIRRAPSDEPSITEGHILIREYISYLRSCREHRELLSCYQGRGERSTEESAKLVGLKLPEKPT